MRPPLQIGITGGIGSGKSLISKIFNCLGVPVYDADSRAKYLMTTDGILMEQIKKEFGELSFANAVLNREYISKLVFEDPEKLNALNALVHPAVGNDYKRWVATQEKQEYVVKEAALMFESNSNEMLDGVIVVVAPEQLRIKRVLQRDAHRNEKQVEAIIKNQMPQEDKVKLANFVIVNDETELVIPQVLKLHSQFINPHHQLNKKVTRN
jgi:dephospho-CoA kinase